MVSFLRSHGIISDQNCGLKAEEVKSAFLSYLRIEDKAKFSISIVVKISVMFFSTRQYLYLLRS